MSGTGSGGATKKTAVRSDEGINISDALSKLQRKAPRKLFWGQCKVFLFGEDFAKSGIKDEFDFLVRHPQPRERAYMFVSEGSAADSLELFPPIERSSSEVLRELTDLQLGFRVTLKDLGIMLKGDAKAFALPLVHILPKPESAEPYQTIPYIKGSAFFKKDKMVAKVSEKTTRGAMWILNEIDEYTVTFAMGGKEGLVSLNPVKASTKLVPKIHNGEWTMTVKVKTDGNIVQNSTALNPMNPKLLKKIERAFEDDVRERIELALREIQHKHKVDVLDFATVFHRKYPKQWEKNKDRWDELFPQVEVSLDIDASIEKPGLINSPGGKPQEEVQNK